MKLVDILARELKEWPENYLDVGQADRGSLHLPGIGPYERHTDEEYTKADDWFTAIVTREQWQAAVDALKAPAWTGEGLPPVGVDALLKIENKLTEGTRLESFPAGTSVYVGGHANFGGCDLAVIIIKGTHFCGTIVPHLLEPVRTADQIEAEERECAITDMCVLLGKDPNRAGIRAMAGVLYEAGYRKQVAP